MLFGSVWLLKGRQFPHRWRPGKNEELAYADRRGNFISPKNSRFCGKNVGRILLVTYRLLVIDTDDGRADGLGIGEVVAKNFTEWREQLDRCAILHING